MVTPAFPAFGNHREPATRRDSWELCRIIGASYKVIDGHPEEIGKIPEGFKWRDSFAAFPPMHSLLVRINRACKLGLVKSPSFPQLSKSVEKELAIIGGNILLPP